MKTNITDFAQAIRENCRGVANKKYIQDSIAFHYRERLINAQQYQQLKKDLLGEQ